MNDNSPITNREIAEAYAAAGYRFVPLSGKKPIHEGYAHRAYALDEINGHNTGLMIADGLVDIDLDWQEARLLGCMLPSSNAKFGRVQNGKLLVTHQLYQSAVAALDFKLPNVQGVVLEGDHANTILQVRTSTDGKPYHVMCPDSMHPDTGEAIDWLARDDNDYLPTEVDPKLLLKRAGELAAAAFFVRFYPAEGSRDDFILCIAGTLLRAGWDEEKVDRFARLVAKAAGDNEVEMRSSKAKRSKKRLDQDRPLYGLPKMAKILGVPMRWVVEVATWLGVRQSTNGPAVFLGPELPPMSRQAWEALSEYTVEDEPGVYLYGDMIARLNGNIEPLDKSSMRYELARAAKWMRPGSDDGKFVPTKPPSEVVADMLASRVQDRIIPVLKGVTTIPIFTRDGTLIDRPGFDYDTGIFYRPTCDVLVPPDPSKEEVVAARDRLLTVLQDFPFEDESDRTHSFSLMLEHVAREMWDGSSPMYIFNKPSPGTGASLLVSCISIIPLGQPAPEKSVPTTETEMEKVLTTFLMEGSPFVFLDNATWLMSSTLSMALTAQRYKARILGVSQSVEVPVRCSWVVTGNNPEVSDEMYRRMIDIRLDAHVERPEERPLSSFRIPNLRRWVEENRPALVSAVLTIVQGWVKAGMPDGERSKASYEDWARVMGGIIAFAGVEGFLETPPDRRPSDPDFDEMRSLIIRWMRLIVKPGERPSDLFDVDFAKGVKAQDLVTMVALLGVPFDFKGREQTRVMGSKLMRYKGQVFEIETTRGEVTVTLNGAQRDNSMRWYLEFEGNDPDVEFKETPF